MAKSSKNSNRPTDPVLRELDAVKRLLVLMLIRDGCSAAHIAKALQMDAGDFSRMMSVRDLKPLRENQKNG